MLYTIVKVLVSAVLIVAIAELAKRATFLGSLLASLPVVSLLAFVWLYLDTRSVEKVAALSNGIFWLVLPSLSLFLVLPVLLRRTGDFFLSLGVAVAVMLSLYLAMVVVLRQLNVEL